MINVFFKTYGCQANVADSEGLMRYLQDLGCSIVPEEALADLIIVNSCAVRQKAEQKMFSYLGQLVQYKKRNPALRMGVIGCVASYRKQELYDRFAHVNFVFGARDDMKTFQAYLFDLITSLETIKQLFETGAAHNAASPAQDRDIKKIVAEKSLFTKMNSFKSVGSVAIKKTDAPVSEIKKSFINIMTGCNNYCSFCIVPFTRGREKSYSMKEIMQRAELEIMAGSKEITLIGQNVNSYQDPDTQGSFAQLLRSVASIPGEFWIRYISPHPKDMTRDVLEVMAEYHTKLCAWVHMPLQSGSDTILERMNRPYNGEHYLEIISWVRSLLPHAAITTDIIVGFPGETDEDYAATRAMVEKVRYDMSYSFMYSPRKYTKAFEFKDDCSSEVKLQRLEALQERQKEICLENNSALVGKTVKVLVEKRFSHDKLLARTEGNLRVFCDGSDDLIGSFIPVIIENAAIAHIEGSVI